MSDLITTDLVRLDATLGSDKHEVIRALDQNGCDDGRRGIFSGNAIVWADGSQSRLASPHPSVIIGNKSSVVIGPGVFSGNGKGGHVPMENPSAPSKARCPVLDGVSYCH